MFTGLVESVGKLVGRSGEHIRVRPARRLDSPQFGESVAVNGCCLTLERDFADGTLEFFTLAETLDRTNLGRLPIGRELLNTIVFAGAVTIISVFFDSLAAYGLSRVDFKGRGVLLGVLIATMMIPGMALLIPVYKLLADMGLVNSYLGIIIPRMADVGGIFLLRQFFISIPKDLDNAARIDGAGEFRIFAQIVLPNSIPAILTVGMFNFMGNWNDLLWPLIMTSRPETRTITAGLAMLTGHGSSVTPYGVVMAGALISALPLLIVFFFVQKRFVEGIAMTGMK